MMRALAEPAAAETALRLASALHWFWLVGGYFAEGSHALEVGLAAGSGVSLTVRANALRAAGHLAQYERDLERSEALLEESLRLALELHDERGFAASRSLLGETARFKGHYERATDLLETALAQETRLGDRWACCLTIYRLGQTARDQGLYERAVALHEQSLTMRRELGDLRGTGASLHCLGLLALSMGDFERAANTLKQALAIHRVTRNKLGIANCLAGLAGCALGDDQPHRAAHLLGAVDSQVELVGGTQRWAARTRFERDIAEARTRLGDHAFEVGHAEGRAMRLDEALTYALAETAPAALAV